MYIDFDDYPPYSGIVFGFFETNNNANIQCYCGYAYSLNKKKNCTWINE